MGSTIESCVCGSRHQTLEAAAGGTWARCPDCLRAKFYSGMSNQLILAGGSVEFTDLPEPTLAAGAAVDLEEGEEAAEAEQVDAIDEAVARLEAEGYTPEEIDDSIRRVEAKAEEGLRQEAAAAARAWLREGLDDEDDDGDGDDGIE